MHAGAPLDREMHILRMQRDRVGLLGDQARSPPRRALRDELRVLDLEPRGAAPRGPCATGSRRHRRPKR